MNIKTTWHQPFAIITALFFALILCLPARAATSLTVLTPVSVTATGGGIDVDVSGLTEYARISLLALNTAGTNPTLTCKLQGSSDATRGLDYQTTGTTSNKINQAANANVYQALTFTQSGAASIKRVAFRLKKFGTLASGKLLTLAINTNNAGAPSGTVVTNGTATTVDIDTAVSTTEGWVVFTFPKPPDLADSTIYHFVLSGDYSASTSNYVGVVSTTVASGGTLNSYDGSAWSATTTQKVMCYVDQYSFADITGGAFTQLATAGNATVQTLSLYAQSLPKYLRLYSTIGGTSNPAFTTGAVLNATRRQEQ